MHRCATGRSQEGDRGRGGVDREHQATRGEDVYSRKQRRYDADHSDADRQRRHRSIWTIAAKGHRRKQRRG